MKRTGLILGGLAVAAVIAIAVLGVSDPGLADPDTTPEAGASEPELRGGYGDLGFGGGAQGSSSGRSSADMPGIDSGLSSLDGGLGAPVPLEPPPPAARLEAPAALPPSVTFSEPRTVEDEYDSATLVWSMIEARREETRTQLAEARSVGDQVMAARLAHQLDLLEIGDHRLEGIVRELDGRRPASAPATPDTAHADGAEGATPR